MTPCAFCDIAGGRAPADLVLDREAIVGFLDLRPLFPGHVLVVPRRHVSTLDELPEDLLAPLFGAVGEVSRAVQTALGAEGSFVAVNTRVSQSVPHLHVHVVPRSRGDGLRGFFWPRTPYDDERHRSTIAAALRAALD